jgi:hypothetical protein
MYDSTVHVVEMIISTRYFQAVDKSPTREAASTYKTTVLDV